MILVTQKDGTSVALNVDRIERIEANPVSAGQESNVFFVGGGHLVVQECQEDLLERVLDAKARVQARAFAISHYPGASDDARPVGAPTLRMLTTPAPGR